MFLRSTVVLAAALALAAPATAQQRNDLANALNAELKVPARDVDQAALADVLARVSKQHGVTFIIMEERFKEKGIANIRDQKSSLGMFDPKGMTLRAFLTAWLGSIDAMFKVKADYLEIVPREAAFDPNDSLAVLLEKLHGDELPAFEGNINEIPLFELMHRLGKRSDVAFTFNELSFRAAGMPDIKEAKPNLSATQLRGLTLHQFLSATFDSVGAVGATYIIRGKSIEIVSTSHAARQTKADLIENEDGRKSLKEPLVSAIFKEKPLNEAVAAIAERYDLTVVVSPQAGDAKTGFVTARLLNVPADQALELLALQNDLRVVRKGPAFLITSREHADGLFQEKLEKERALIELDKFRQMKPPPPEAPSPQPKLDQPLRLKLDLVPQLKGDVFLPIKPDLVPQPKPPR
jgi:hypothetical protein